MEFLTIRGQEKAVRANRLDGVPRMAHRDSSMKAAIAAGETASNGHTKPRTAKQARPRMTRRLAEKRAVGDPGEAKFDGVALLRSLKK